MKRALLGLVGAGIGRSISPAMHEAAGRALGIDVRYHLIDADLTGLRAAALPQLFAGLKLAAFTGVNVTFPFKQAATSCLDRIEGAAQALGAVNTIVVRDGRLIGHNTDYTGFIGGWKRSFGDRNPGIVALVGAGGVGRAIAHALAALGASELRIADLDSARAAALCEALRGRHPALRATVAPDAASACAGATGVVNATPVGMSAFPGTPVAAALMEGREWATDAVYTPLETQFVAAARRSGATVMTGQELAIGQAVDAFALFFGRPAPQEVMREAFLAAIEPDVSGSVN